MAIVYPSGLDSFTDPTAGLFLGTLHLNLHQDLNSAVEALEAKVGVDGSTVATSVDYLLRNRLAIAKTASYSVAATDGGRILTNAGAAGSVTLTLPASPTDGMLVGAYVATNQALRVTPSGSHRFSSGVIALGNGEYLESSRVGSFIWLRYDSSSSTWQVLELRGTWGRSSGAAFLSPTSVGLPSGSVAKNAGSTSEQEVAETKFRIPGNSLAVGSRVYYRFLARIDYGPLENPTLRWRIRAGGTGGVALVDSGNVSPYGGDSVVRFEGMILVGSTGGSGSISALWAVSPYATSGNSGLVSSSLDTTVDQDLSLTLQFGSGGSSGTSLTLYGMEAYLT